MVSCAEGEYIEKLYVRFRTPGDDFVRSVHRSLQRLRTWLGPVIVCPDTHAAAERDTSANGYASADGNACADARADRDASADRDAYSELHLRSTGEPSKLHLSRWERWLLGQRQSL